jgi:hypothetical protein
MRADALFGAGEGAPPFPAYVATGAADAPASKAGRPAYTRYGVKRPCMPLSISLALAMPPLVLSRGIC